MTTELMVVAVVLAILSGISASAVPAFANRAKRAALASTLSVLQGAVDRFFIESNECPALSQPLPISKACELDLHAEDAAGNRFLGAYVHSAPNTRAIDYGLDAGDGATVFFGLTATGRVFATQIAPVTSEWSSGAISILTQENVSGDLVLSAIW